MTVRDLHTAAATGAAALLLAGGPGCGGDGRRAPARDRPAPARPATSELTPAERRAVAERRREERAHVSSTALARRVAALPTIDARRALVRDLRREILRDARRRAVAGRIEGPVRAVSCRVDRADRPLAEAHPDTPVLRYACLAMKVRPSPRDEVAIGVPYQARVDAGRGRFAWCRYTPPGGEGAHTAVTFAVQPPAACVAPPPPGR